MAKKNDVEVTVQKTEKVENAKTRKQQEEAAAIKKRKEEADAAAEAEREETARKRAELEEEKRRFEEQKKAEEKAREEEAKKKAKQTEAMVAAGAALAGGALKKGGSFGKGLIIGLLIGAIASFAITRILFAQPPAPEVHYSTPEDLEEPAGPGYTALDFQNAVLGEASEHQELVVMEQPVQMTTTVTKSGLGNLSVFRKTKTITYYGTGVFTVDLKDLDKDHILVDEKKQTVTLKVPKPTLQYLEPDYEKTEFEDTDKGLLAWGDLALTAEQQNEIEKSIDAQMREFLSQAEVQAQAEEFARMKVWDTFQPLVTAVSPEYKVDVELE